MPALLTVSLFCQTMNDQQAVLLGTVVEKNSLFDIIWVNHPLRHWKDALEQFKHCRTLQEQTNTSKVCTRISEPLTSGTFSTCFIAYGYSCGVVQDGYGHEYSTEEYWHCLVYGYGRSMSMTTGVLWNISRCAITISNFLCGISCCSSSLGRYKRNVTLLWLL